MPRERDGKLCNFHILNMSTKYIHKLDFLSTPHRSPHWLLRDCTAKSFDEGYERESETRDKRGKIQSLFLATSNSFSLSNIKKNIMFLSPPTQKHLLSFPSLSACIRY
jgi:hypothetical protein